MQYKTNLKNAKLTSERKSFYTFMAILLTSIAISCSGCIGDTCEKKYTLTGVVADSLLNRVADVEIRWHYDDPSHTSVTLGYSGLQGEYNIDYPTRSSLAGDRIEFVKPGYLISIAEPYLISEAGPDICGDITLRRDAILQP